MRVFVVIIFSFLLFCNLSSKKNIYRGLVTYVLSFSPPSKSRQIKCFSSTLFEHINMHRRSLSDQSLYSSSPAKKVMSRKFSYAYDRWTFIFFLFGSINILSALWMLIAPSNWYYHLLASVPEYGPLNIHFVRDIGCVFLLLGCGLIVGGFLLMEFSLPLFTMNTLFYMLHMFVHIYEVVSGRVRMEIFWVDLPGIYVPALLTFILNIVLIRKYMASSTSTIHPIRTRQ